MGQVTAAGGANNPNFSVVDFGDPENSVLVNPSFQGACQVNQDGTNLYVGNLLGGQVQLFDISQPAAPVAHGTASTVLATIGAIAIRGTRVAVGEATNIFKARVCLIDFSSPGNPVILGTAPTPLVSVTDTNGNTLAAISSLAFIGPHLVVASGPANFIIAIVDFTNPANPVVTTFNPKAGPPCLDADENAQRIVTGDTNASWVRLYDTGWNLKATASSTLNSVDSISLSGLRALTGSNNTTQVALIDFGTTPPTVTTFDPKFVGGGSCTSIKGTRGCFGDTLGSHIKLFDLTTNPPTLHATANAKLDGVGSVGLSTLQTLPLGITPAKGNPTTKVGVSGSGFIPLETVGFFLGGAGLMGTTTANKSGAIAASVVIPGAERPGYHTIRATGKKSRRIAEAEFLVRTNWSMFGYNPQHMFANPYENVLTPSNVSSLSLAWTGQTTDRIISSSPAVDGGTVYICSTSATVYAFDAMSGLMRWNFNPGGLFSSSAVANGVVYVGIPSGVYALDASTGTKLWNFSPPSEFESSPTVANGVVYIGSYDFNVYALDAVTGTKRWNYMTGAQVSSSPAIAQVKIKGKNIQVVYVGSEDASIYALNATTGAKVWSYRTGNGVYSSPTVANGVVYIGSTDKQVYALDGATGIPKWTRATEGQVISSPAVANSTVYVGSNDFNLYALDATTGAPKWIFPTSGPVSSSPAVANGVVYVGSEDGLIYALDATSGGRLWSYTIVDGGGGPGFSSPAVADGFIFIGSPNSKVYAFTVAV